MSARWASADCSATNSCRQQIAETLKPLLPEVCEKASALGREVLQIPKSDLEFMKNASAHTAKELNWRELNRACKLALYEVCAAKLKPEIEKSKLDKLFTSFTKDPVLRMKDPAVMCFKRASVLAEKLHREGYKTKVIHITQAPAMIGVVRDPTGLPTGFYNYSGLHEGDASPGGDHFAVSVIQSEGTAKEEVILDPQFQDRPLPRDEYFKISTGVRCHTGVAANFWDCTYREHAPTEDVLQEAGNPYSTACGWEHAEHGRKAIQQLNQTGMSLVPKIPEDLLKSRNLQGDLVSREWQQQRDGIKRWIDESEKLLARKVLSDSEMESLATKIERAKKNLELFRSP